MLGSYLTPTLSYACEKATETIEISCCKKENAQADTKDCCKQSSSSKGTSDDDCSGKCGNASCHCPGAKITIALPFIFGQKSTPTFVEKQSIHYTETYVSSLFRSIWQPPKIG